MIDSGKGHHHGLALDADGKTLLSRRVANDELELMKLIGDVLALADGRRVAWAIDMTGSEPALLLALLVNHGQEVLYIPGRLVNRTCSTGTVSGMGRCGLHGHFDREIPGGRVDGKKMSCLCER